MGLMDFADLETVVDIPPLPDNWYGQVAIRAVRQSPTWLQIRLEPSKNPYCKDIIHFLNLPQGDIPPKKLQDAKYKLREFMECFGIGTAEEMNPEADWIGSEGWVILGLTEHKKYGWQNWIKTFDRGVNQNGVQTQ